MNFTRGILLVGLLLASFVSQALPPAPDGPYQSIEDERAGFQASSYPLQQAQPGADPVPFKPMPGPMPGSAPSWSWGAPGQYPAPPVSAGPPGLYPGPSYQDTGGAQQHNLVNDGGLH